MNGNGRKSGKRNKKELGAVNIPKRTLQIGKLFTGNFTSGRKLHERERKKFSPFKKLKAFSWLAFKNPDKSVEHLSSMRELEIIELRRHSKQQVVDI